MHTVTLQTEGQIGPMTFPAQVPLLCEDVFAGQMLGWFKEATAERWGALQGPLPIKWIQPGGAKEVNRLGIIRPGGFGDLLFLSPTLYRLHELFPDAQIEMVAFRRYWEALSPEPWLSWVEYPCPIEVVNQWDAILLLEGIVENERESHAVDVIAMEAGVSLVNKRGRYQLSAEVAEAMAARFPRKEGHPRLAVQVEASAKCRTYPHSLQFQVWERLLNRLPTLELFLFGEPGMLPINTADRRVTNLAMLEEPPSFTESLAILSQCDALMAPDSALAHYADPLGVPTVALYGPFPWQLRTDYAPGTWALQGHAPCAPCFNDTRQGAFPLDGPCAASGRCEALAEIKPERVASMLEYALLKAAGKNNQLS